MSLQTIVDNATFITIDYNKLSAQSISRSGRLLTAEIASAVPFRINIGMHNGLTYSSNRDLVTELGNLDITEESTIDIGSTNTNLSYVTAWRGDSTGIASITVNSATAKTINLNCVAAGSGTFLFKKGDYIQPAGGYRYPYIVTADVAHSTGGSVNVPIHRTFIPQDSYTLAGKNINVGVDVDFRVKMISKPSYSIVPHDRIEFNSDFELVEVIRKEDT